MTNSIGEGTHSPLSLVFQMCFCSCHCTNASVVCYLLSQDKLTTTKKHGHVRLCTCKQWRKMHGSTLGLGERTVFRLADWLSLLKTTSGITACAHDTILIASSSLTQFRKTFLCNHILFFPSLTKPLYYSSRCSYRKEGSIQ